MSSSGVDGSVAFVISGVNEAVLDAMTRFSSEVVVQALRHVPGWARAFEIFLRCDAVRLEF